MNKYRHFVRLVAFLLCLGLLLPADAAPKQKKSKNSATKKKKSSKSKKSRARNTSSLPRKSFDEMIGTAGAAAPGRVMISEVGDAEQSGAQID